MNILTLNLGSSSIKYQLIKMPSEEVVCYGLIERMGTAEALISHFKDSEKIVKTEGISNHKNGLEYMAELLNDEKIDAVGHRVVHGGSLFSNTTIITAEVKEKIRELIPLAPLHNPANLQGIIMAEEIFPKAKQVAVFDTAFHQSIPEMVSKYAIPNEYYSERNIRLFGFHGISHKYVSEKANIFLGKSESKLITIHLGNGCSITAVKNGKSVDHSMGFAPTNGLIMGTRSGDIDFSIIFYMVETLGYDLYDVKTLLLNKSGMFGLTGFSDLRDIQKEAQQGNKECLMALEMNAYRIKKYIGSYAAAMNGLDAIVFTAGIGENSSVLRKMICDDMDFLGINIDESLNNTRSSGILDLSSSNSTVKTLIVPTNEELEIAKQTYNLYNLN